MTLDAYLFGQQSAQKHRPCFSYPYLKYCPIIVTVRSVPLSRILRGLDHYVKIIFGEGFKDFITFYSIQIPWKKELR